MIQIVAAFIANSIAHIISYIQLNKVKAPNAMGALTFVFINITIAFFIWKDHDWSKWLALIFPLVGGLSLLITTIIKKKGKPIDYIIFVLDIIIIGLVFNYYFK